MPMRWLAYALLVLVMGCGAAQKPASSEDRTRGGEPPGLVFAWKLPAVASVRHERVRKSGRLEVGFLLCARGLDGGLIEVRELDHQLLAGDDDDGGLTSGAQPVLLVSADGSVYDVLGIEKRIAYTLREIARTVRDPALRARAEEQLHSPAMLAQLKAKHAETWHLWVDTWLNFDPKQKKAVVETTIPFGGVELTAPQTFVYLGRVGSGRLVKLGMRSVLEGPKASRALARMTEQYSGARGLEGLELRRQVDVELETDPATLQPHRVSSRVHTRVKLPSGETNDRSDSDLFEFDWKSDANAQRRCRDASEGQVR